METITVLRWQMPVFINCFSLAVLFIILVNNRQEHLETKSQRYFFFQNLVLSNIVLLIFDGLTWVFVGSPVPSHRLFHVLASIIFYITAPLPSFFFIGFVDVVLNIPSEKRRKLMWFYAIPVAINFIIASLSPFTNWYFQIDPVNHYQRGSLFFVSFLLSYALLAVAVGKVLATYHELKKSRIGIAKNVKEFRWMLEYTSIPVIGGIVQVMFNNVTYIWNFTVLGLIILYINYQNVEITTDSLTGLYNRRQSYFFFERFMRERTREKATIAVVMIDINNFKKINDKFGHTQGDDAITAVAKVLETEFRWDDFICRFGGDEFVIITKHGELKTLKAILDAVDDHLLSLHKEGKYPFELAISAGYAQYSRKNRKLDTLIKQADAMMFEQKAKLLRRAGDKEA